MQRIKMNIIITDITYMKEKFCVAGYNYMNKKVIRLMPNGSHWEEKELKKIDGFCLVNVEGKYPSPSQGRQYPHRTEDFHIDLDTLEIIKSFESMKELREEIKESSSLSIQGIFKNNVKRAKYVPAKTKCKSLGAVELPVSNLEFIKENGKLRLHIKDSDNKEYNVKVSSKMIRDFYFKNGEDLEKLNEHVFIFGENAHVRIGLARAFSMQNNHCYLMCNGIFIY